jgi:malonyl-ACP O-methyltransferase BioC
MNKRSNIKAAVAAAFSAAADTYNVGADIQREVAETLARRIQVLPLIKHPRILEIGCGTGFLSRALETMEPSTIVLSDISEAMLARCREALGPTNATFIAMDGEQPTIAPGFDLICSSLAFQWFGDLPSALERLAGLLAPGGHLAFATLGADSFDTWKQAYADCGMALAMRSYPSPDSFTAGHIEDEHLTRHYANGRVFLDELKLIGAHLPEDHHQPATPGALRRVLRTFENGIDVTYHIIYGMLSKT